MLTLYRSRKKTIYVDLCLIRHILLKTMVKRPFEYNLSLQIKLFIKKIVTNKKCIFDHFDQNIVVNIDCVL